MYRVSVVFAIYRSKRHAHQAHVVLIIPDIASQLFTNWGKMEKQFISILGNWIARHTMLTVKHLRTNGAGSVYLLAYLMSGNLDYSHKGRWTTGGLAVDRSGALVVSVRRKRPALEPDASSVTPAAGIRCMKRRDPPQGCLCPLLHAYGESASAYSGRPVVSG